MESAALGWLDKRVDVRADRERPVLARYSIDARRTRGHPVRRPATNRRSRSSGDVGRHIVVLDEPAAALGVRQSEMVLSFVRMLAGGGVAVVFITTTWST